MTNIYNKKVLVENGTLINNWYEEEVLKKLTGESRSIPGLHVKKTHMGSELYFLSNDGLLKDKTKVRLFGNDVKHPYDTTNHNYGDFSSEEHKFNKLGVKDKIFKDFFTSYMTNEKHEKNQHESKISNNRLNESTYKSSFIKQPMIQKIGSRHMLTQDLIDVDYYNLDKYFMAKHNMSKYQRYIPEDKLKDYFSNDIPYYHDKALTFWIQNIEKSNVYRTHMNGENCFNKSSGFTNPLNQTKSAKTYYGNVQNDRESRFVHVPENTTDFVKLSEMMTIRVQDLTTSIREKFLDVMNHKGWMSIRKYKLYLHNLSKRKSTIIEKSDFKYYSINFGIYFTDDEINFIYNIFDFNKSNKINYEDFIEGLINVSFKFIK